MTSKKYEIFCEAILKRVALKPKSIEEVRIQFEKLMAEYPPLPDLRVEPISIGELSASWFFAPEASRKKIILFLHGGGYIAGSIESHKNLIGRLSAATNAAVLAVSYRLAPEHPYPAALEDALAAYRWLLHHPYARSRIVIVGLSAGGGLALSLLLKLKAEKIAMPAGAVCFCPWVDLQREKEEAPSQDILSIEKLQWGAEQYAGKESLKDPLISPIHGDLKGIPSLFIQTGTRDLLHPEAVKLAEKAKKEKVDTTLDVWKDMIHNWTLFAPEFPEAEEAIEKAAKFLNELWAADR
jgi:acetyl esterase/lipase